MKKKSNEIEITTAMIDAGCSAFDCWLDRFDGFEGWPDKRAERALVSSVLKSALQAWLQAAALERNQREIDHEEEI